VLRKIGGKGRSPLVPLAILLFLVNAATAAQKPDPLFGTWRLNFSKSKFVSGPPAYARVTCEIVPWADGLKVTYDMVGERGGVTHWEWIGKLDGNDYALQGNEEVVTNAYSRIGDNGYEVVNKINGRTTSTTQIAISPDGKVMTVTSKVSAQGQSVVNTAIYEKR
jgi:hypothetical protein